jgi:8-amino-7-oxononanoate synthase
LPRSRRITEPMLEPVGTAQRQLLTPIQPIVLGSSEAALSAQRALLEAGFCVVAIRPPTVPRGSARLRVTLSAAHTEAQVDALVEALARVCVGHPGVKKEQARNDMVSR